MLLRLQRNSRKEFGNVGSGIFLPGDVPAPWLSVEGPAPIIARVHRQRMDSNLTIPLRSSKQRDKWRLGVDIAKVVVTEQVESSSSSST